MRSTYEAQDVVFHLRDEVVGLEAAPEAPERLETHKRT